MPRRESADWRGRKERGFFVRARFSRIFKPCCIVCALIACVWGTHFLVVMSRTHRLVREVTTGSEATTQIRDVLAAQAVDTLGGPRRAAGRLRSYLRLPNTAVAYHRTAYDLLGYCGESATDTLVQALGDDDDLLVHIVKLALAKQGTKTVQSLSSALGDRNKRRVENALLILADMGSPARGALPDIERLLDHPDGCIRAFAAMAHWQISGRTEKTLSILISDFKTANDEKHLEAIAYAFLCIGEEARDAAPCLSQGLAGGNLARRRAAARALIGMGAFARDAIPSLVDSLAEEDTELRYSALFALRSIGLPARGELPKLVQIIRTGNLEEVRATAVSALEVIGGDSPEVVPMLVDLLEDRQERVRGVSAEVLGNIGVRAKIAVPALTQRLVAESGPVRLAAIRALGKIGSAAKEAVPVLERLLRDEHEYVRNDIAEALRKIRGWAYPEEKPKDEAAPDAAPKTPAPPAPESVKEPGQDAP